jgi:hypothetical protein
VSLSVGNSRVFETSGHSRGREGILESIKDKHFHVLLVVIEQTTCAFTDYLSDSFIGILSLRS